MHRQRWLGDRTAVHQARKDAEADTTGDHRRGAEQQERGLGRTGLGELVLALALLDRLVADAVGVRAGSVGVTGRGTGGPAVGATIGTAVSATISTAVSATISTAVSTAIGTAVNATVSTAIGTAVDATVSTAVNATIGTAVDATVSTAVNATIGTAVNATIGTAVDATIGATVNATIGATVNATIGTAVSATIGTAVSTAVGATVSTAVSTAVNTAIGTAVDPAEETAVGSITGSRLGADAGLVGVHTDTDSEAEARGLSRTRSGERGSRGDNRAGGYPRDEESRLLGHLLLPPVADLVDGAAVCGPRPCGVTLRGATPYRGHPARPRSHLSQTYACCSSSLARVKDYVKAVPGDKRRYGGS
ncbi:hypothetical protein ACFW9O_11720 [Streptomyces sp. NPDC059499]|uniref:hypothetical protein n=1 Tax=Streptomyces sp. NPDC059499 TaxID=3346852 RepID=UPI003678A6A4